MNKELLYPIKYAVLELKERGGWIAGYEDITQGFIASKCYVVESNMKYNADGTNNLTHKVVFPLKDIELFKTSIMNGRRRVGPKNIPAYNACNNPYPVNIVDDLFDTFEEAKAVAEEKTEEFKRSLLNTFSFLDSNWQEKLNKFEKEQEKKKLLCDLYEKIVQEETEELIVNEQESFLKLLKH